MNEKFCFLLKNGENIKNFSLKLKEVLESKGLIYDENEPQYVISIGGDGTFLRAISNYREKNPIFVGVNFGNLGFLCEYKEEEFDLLVNDLTLNDGKAENVRLLECEVENKKYYAFNEFRVQSKNHETIVLDVYFDELYLETLRGDGCCISSSYGSSGLNKSLGGAVISKEIELLEFTEMAPIQNKTYQTIGSSIVLSPDTSISLKHEEKRDIILCFDSNSVILNEFCGVFHFVLGKTKVKILKNGKNNYVKKLHEAFIYE